MACSAGAAARFSILRCTAKANPTISSNSTGHGLAVLGGGIDVRLTRRISIRGEVRDLVTGAGLSGAKGRHHVLPLFGVALPF